MAKTTKINETFTCIRCKKLIPLAKKTCRNHCPFCFTSLHVDGEMPGDRASLCGGKMFPIDYQIKNSDYKILFQCEICGKQHRNKRAEDDEVINLLTFIKKGL